MSLVFTERSLELERLDREALGPEEITQVLQGLETINGWLGGVRATLSHFKRWSTQWKPGERIRILDWGAGGADIPRALVRWGRSLGYRIEVTGVDNSKPILEYARKQCRSFPEIQIVSGDLSSFSPDRMFDYAVSSLTLHHLPDNVIVELLRKSDQITTRGIVMNDLIRSARAWAWIWTLSRMGRAHPMVRHDGPLSVRRAFTKTELEYLAQKAGLSYLKVRTHFGYRYTLAGEKQS